MNVLGLIPARGGSKGIPGKNTKLLGGKPLLQYTAVAALASSRLTDVVLTTDDESIAHLGRLYGVQVPFIRPAALANDTAPTLPVIVHALQALAQLGRHYDAVCLLQPTTPFRPAGFIDIAIQTFASTSADSLVSVRPVPDEYNPHWTFEVTPENLLRVATGDKTIISRRQDLPKTYHRDGSIYLSLTDTILNKNSIYGDSIAYLENTNEAYINIDTPHDWQRAENLLQQFQQ
jgi:N-acylneuraminate cytidylyltransferase